MKRLVTIMLIGLLCALMVAAGCTGIPKTSTAPAAAPTGVPGPSLTGAAGPNWTGTWTTTWTGGVPDTKMALVQSGTTVTGTYEYNEGRIIGIVQGDRLIGTWSEGSGGAGSSGPIEYVFSSDGKSFGGWWGYTGEDMTAIKKETPSWTGIRLS
jgi:hypothetical protein